MTNCKACAQCSDTPPCADSCHSRPEPWWPDDYPKHNSFYPTGYKCTSISHCLGCPACTGKPNVVSIFTDDVALHDLVSPHLPLKNMNMLKRSGMSFTDAHSTPLCAPSRYAILSGRLPFRGRRRSGTEIHNFFCMYASPRRKYESVWCMAFQSPSALHLGTQSRRHMDVPRLRISVHVRTKIDRKRAQGRGLSHRHVWEMVRSLRVSAWCDRECPKQKFCDCSWSKARIQTRIDGNK